MHTASKWWSINDLNISHVIGYIFISKKEKLFYQAAKKPRRRENCINILSFGQICFDFPYYGTSVNFRCIRWPIADYYFSLSTTIAVERTSSLTLPCICTAEVRQLTTECTFAIPHNFIVFSCYCSVDIFTALTHLDVLILGLLMCLSGKCLKIYFSTRPVYHSSWRWLHRSYNYFTFWQSTNTCNYISGS